MPFVTVLVYTGLNIHHITFDLSHNAAYLNKQRGMLGGAVSQVVAVDGQHTVVYPQPPVTGSQPPLQQVEDEDAMFVRPAHQLNAQLFIWSPLNEDHMQAVIPDGGGVCGEGLGGGVVVGTVTVALLAQYGQPQQCAGLLQSRHSITVRHVTDVYTIDLKGRQQMRERNQDYIFKAQTVKDGANNSMGSIARN